MTDILIPYSVLLFILSLLITVASLSKIIPKLKELARQPIYNGGPSWHAVKSGTPTMGGIVFLFVFLLITLISLPLFSASDEWAAMLILSVFSLLNGAIGIFDDIMKLKRKQNKGLSARQKIVLQTILAVAFLALRSILFGDGTEIRIFELTLNLGILYYPLSLVLILGAVNCTNLTDGVDGLLSSVTLISSTIMTMLCLTIDLPYAVLCSTIVGITLGFLFYNVFPAKVFMGDTGSLFLGAFIISTLYSIKAPATFFSIGVVFILEGISVILQVLVFKLTRKRLFLMSPLHHHLERRGFSETQICIMAIITTVLCSLPILIFGAL